VASVASRTRAVIDFWSWQLVGAMALNAVVQCIQIGAYAARLAGVKSGRIATSISLFNLFVTASRLANLFYAPMLGQISDRAAATGALHAFEWQARAIVLAGTVGTALGALALPAFLMLFLRGIASFERTNSVPRTLLRAVSLRTLVSLAESLRLPPPSHLSRFSIRHVPINLLVFNTIVTGIYAIGVVAAVYASVIDPAGARTAVLLSGIINGIATISFTLIVDPTSAYITDQAAKGERPVEDVKSMVFYLSLTAILGTLLSQFILVPAAYVIAFAAHLFNLH
jgi:hypothetical protein